jgi:hypothetical protein
MTTQVVGRSGVRWHGMGCASEILDDINVNVTLQSGDIPVIRSAACPQPAQRPTFCAKRIETKIN